MSTGLRRTAASGNAVRTFYDTPEKVAVYERTVASSGTSKMMNGRPYAVDTIAGITAYEVTMTALVAVALMTTFMVVRHTRAEEESGRGDRGFACQALAPSHGAAQ